LTENSVTWEFCRARICLGGTYHRLYARAVKGQRCRRVLLQGEVTIPPRSEIDLPTSIICRSIKETDDEAKWATEPNTLKKGLYVSRTLVPTDRLHDIPIRVVNTSSRPVTLDSGISVTLLQPVVEVISSTNVTSETTQKPGQWTSSEEASDRQDVPEFVKHLMENIHPSVTESTAIALEEILLSYRDVFSECEGDLGLTDLVTHQIDTENAVPFRQQLRRFPPAHVQAISEHVENMLAQGVIEPARSPWASNIVLVRKKDNSFRCCIDYRQLNSVTRKDAYPLPRIDACLDAMASAQWFSTIDLRSSYHQVKVDTRDCDKTAFICPRGMYRFRTMPFGLCNAGSTFQRLMDIVMAGLHLEICLVYLDDIIVYSNSLESHLNRLVTVLSRLRFANLKLKPEKCIFLQKSVSFLGHVISSDGISTDPQKVKTVSEWPTPACTRDVRAFLGLAGYYRRFVKSFAHIASPLNQLLKNGSFSWTIAAQKAFDDLKTALTSPPILAMPTDDDEFTLDTDASDYAIGAVLSQKQNGVERVVAYASRALDRRERNYCVTRKELLAVVNFFKVFKQYLLGRHFRVRTDHAALSWLKHTPEPIGQQARWLEQMEEFDYVIEHRAGKSHGNADALSRIICPKRDCVCRQEARQSGNEAERLGIPPFSGPADRQSRLLPDNSAVSVETNGAAMKCDTFGCDEPTSCIQLNRTVTVCNVQHDTDEELPKVLENQVEVDYLGCDRRGVGSSNTAGLNDEAVRAGELDPGIPAQYLGRLLPWTWDGLKSAQRTDGDISVILKLKEDSTSKPAWSTVALESKDVKTLWNQWHRLSIRDGLLKRRFESPEGNEENWQVIWPKESRGQFLEIAHSGMTGGHLGRQKTAAAVQSRAYWPFWSNDLDKFMEQCEPCARYHRGSVKRRAQMQVSLVGEPWERVSVDITGPHPRSSRNNQYILTLVDHFSKWAEAIPIKNHKAPTVAKVLMVHVFSRFGAPLQLLTDMGPEFESDLFAQLMRLLEIDKLRTTPYKPSTNGVVERFHRTLNSMLGKTVGESQRDWDERLPYVMAAYRASPHSSTGFSPNRLFLGRENRMPIDLLMGLPIEGGGPSRTADLFVTDVREKTERAYHLARNQLRVAAERRKNTYDIRVRKAEHSVGDWVWYHYPRRYRFKSHKWQKNFTGPFLVVRAIEPVNFVLQKTQRSKPFVVHADKIKRCFGPTPVSWLPLASQPVNNIDVSVNMEPAMCHKEPAVQTTGAKQGGLKVRNTPPQRARKRRGAILTPASETADDESSTHRKPGGAQGIPRRRNPPCYLQDFDCRA